MDEQAELQARIAALAGKINQRKQQPQPPQYRRDNVQHFPQQHRGTARWTPYGSQGVRGGYAQPHKNRTLVLNGINTSPATSPEPALPSPLVSARRANHQLMTKETYEREQSKKSFCQEQHHDVKRRRKNVEEQYRIRQHFERQPRPDSRQVLVNGVSFTLTAGGSKLVRASGKDITLPVVEQSDSMLNALDSNPNLETPKRHEIAGVMFYRTRTGNLVRGSALTAAARYPHASQYDSEEPDSRVSKRRSIQKQAPQCEHFTKHGIALQPPQLSAVMQLATLSMTMLPG